jgi:hypothetical protein
MWEARCINLIRIRAGFLGSNGPPTWEPRSGVSFSCCSQATTVHIQACDCGSGHLKQFAVLPTTREFPLRKRGKTTCCLDAKEQCLLVKVTGRSSHTAATLGLDFAQQFLMSTFANAQLEYLEIEPFEI